MMVAPRILVVEDDQLIGESLTRALRSQHYRAVHVTTLADAQAEVDSECPDLVLLDVMLPDGNGVEFCSRLTASHPSVPVMMLTARTDETDVVSGLHSGAVDYITKPFRLAELFARVASQLTYRSRSVTLVFDVTGGAAVIEIGGIVIDSPARRVLVDGGEVELRPKEFDLLYRLASAPNTVVTREQLIADVWDENWWGPTKTLDVHINALRRKLGVATGESGPISTIRGVGYRFESS
jgi:DNA-binding response OmpR family regulator